MRKLLSVFLVLAMVFSFVGCSNEKSDGFKVPDVFGIDYNNAIEILEADGFEVNAIATSVASVSEKLLYPLETVDKGVVFKVEEYILDNNGNLNKNYDYNYDGELVSEDKSIIIYYAKEDYKKDSKVSAPSSSNITSKPTPSNNSTTSTKPSSSGLSSDFKAAMDSYESFMNDYVAFMKKYQANPTDLSLLSDYADYMSKYTKFVSDFEKWENDDLNTAELSYYLDVQTRVTKKLLEVAQ